MPPDFANAKKRKASPPRPTGKRPSDTPEPSEEYDAFEELARKLVKVPKDELDKALVAAKNGKH